MQVKVYLVRHFQLGWFPRITDIKKSKEILSSISLLSASELAFLYPRASIYREKILGMTKSLIAIGPYDSISGFSSRQSRQS